jgi:hypothetical protein
MCTRYNIEDSLWVRRVVAFSDSQSLGPMMEFRS